MKVIADRKDKVYLGVIGGFLVVVLALSLAVGLLARKNNKNKTEDKTETASVLILPESEIPSANI